MVQRTNNIFMKIKVNGKDCTYIKRVETNPLYIVYENDKGEQDIIEESELIQENPEFKSLSVVDKELITTNTNKKSLDGVIIPAIRLNKLTFYNILLMIHDTLYYEKEFDKGFKFDKDFNIIPVFNSTNIGVSDIIFETEDDCKEVLKCLKDNYIIYKNK